MEEEVPMKLCVRSGPSSSVPPQPFSALRKGKKNRSARHERRKLDPLNPKLVEQPPRDPTPNRKRNRQPSNTDRHTRLEIAFEQVEVGFHPDAEEEEAQPEFGEEGQVGYACGGEDVGGEAGDLAKGGGAEEDACEDDGFGAQFR